MKITDNNKKHAGINLRSAVNVHVDGENLEKNTVLDGITWKVLKLMNTTWQNVIQTALGDSEKNSGKKKEKPSTADGDRMQNLHVSELSSGIALSDNNRGGKELKEESFHGGESVMFKTPSTNLINTKCFN